MVASFVNLFVDISTWLPPDDASPMWLCLSSEDNMVKGWCVLVKLSKAIAI